MPPSLFPINYGIMIDISGSFEEDTELPEGLKNWNKDKDTKEKDSSVDKELPQPV